MFRCLVFILRDYDLIGFVLGLGSSIFEKFFR